MIRGLCSPGDESAESRLSKGTVRRFSAEEKEGDDRETKRRDSELTVTEGDGAAEDRKPSMSCIGPRFYAIAPSYFERYERPDTVEDVGVPYDIAAPTVIFSWEPPRGWSTYVHPEGARYFCRETEFFTIFTDANLYDRLVLSATEDFVHQVMVFVQENRNRLEGTVSFTNATDTIDLVLDVTLSGDNKLVCGYYLAYRPNRTVFWFDTFEASKYLWGNLNGVTSSTHIHHEIRSQYWHHCALFPCSRFPSQDIVDELKDTLIHAIGDSLVSPTANIPYPTETMEKMLNLVDSTCPRNYNGGFARIIYIILKKFAHEQFQNFAGQPAARVDRGTSVYNKTSNRYSEKSLFFRAFNLLLLGAPRVHLQELDEMLTDGFFSQTTWNVFAQKLLEEWSDLTFFATVLLNANVAFLSIQNEDLGRPAVQFFAYLSVASSLGSVLFGMVLLRKSRHMVAFRDSDQAANFLIQDVSYGYERLAVLLGLPYALFMWGMFMFVGAFLAMTILSNALWATVVAMCSWVLLLGAGIFYVAMFHGGVLGSDGRYPSFRIRRLLASFGTRIRGLRNSS